MPRPTLFSKWVLALGFLLALQGCGDDGQPSGKDLFSFPDRGAGCTGCAGCCDPNTNTCQSGTSSAACGFSGLTCSICTSTQQCLNGQCIDSTPQCSSTSCAGGCCGPSGCVSPPTTAFCGTGGASCRSCLNDQVCRNGQCESAGPVNYAVTIVSATLAGESGCNDTEVGDSECDSYVEVIFLGTTYGPSPTIPDNNSPVWQAQLFTATDTQLKANGVQVKVHDEDIAVDDLVGNCTITVTSGHLSKGELTTDCGANVSNLKLRFQKKS